MALDPIRNFAYGTLTAGISDTDTSLTISDSDASKFPDPNTDGAFNVVVYNYTDYKDPAEDPDVEIVRITASSSSGGNTTYTITRAQEGTTAKNHNTAGKTYRIVLAPTKKLVDDIEKDLLDWVVINSNTTAEAGKGYLIDASASSITLTLPASPSVGDKIGVCDYTHSAGTNTITIARNGNNIEGQAEDLVIDVNGAGFVLVYTGTTRGWEIVTDYPALRKATGADINAGTDDAKYVTPYAIKNSYLENKILADITVSSDCTYVDITGLDINTHGAYELVLNLKNPQSSDARILIFVEGDYTQTNYYSQFGYFSESSLYMNRENQSTISYVHANISSCANAIIWKDINGYFRYISKFNLFSPSSVELQLRSGAKTQTVSNITSIRFYSTLSNGIGSGSRIILRRVL